MVHALSEYRPKFADDISASLEDMYFVSESVDEACGELVRTAKVANDKTIGITSNATNARVVVGSLRFDATLCAVF